MERLLKSAAVAWNPIGEVRRRLDADSLNAGSMLGPFVGIVIACNVAGIALQQFFLDVIVSGMGGEMPSHPLLTSNAQRILSAIGVLVPVGAVSILPSSVFVPAGRSQTIGAILAVWTSWAFYGAVFSAPGYVMGGLVGSADPQRGFATYVLLGGLGALATLALTLFFWFRVLVSVLELGLARTLVITLAAGCALAVLLALIVFAMSPQL